MMATGTSTKEDKSPISDIELVSIHHWLPVKGTGWSRNKSCSETGAMSNLMADFRKHRVCAVKLKRSEVTAELRKPLCAQRASVVKFDALEEEMRKLVKKYEENSSGMKGVMLELKTRPSWQKLPQWVEPSKASNCFKCSRRFKPLSQKVNCRVGGQVFCSDCSVDQVVLYSTEEGVTKWAVNGKPGGPSVTPSNYALLPICCDCSNDLQAIVLKSLANATSNSMFLEQLHRLHQTISLLELNIDVILPRYLKIVNSLNMEDNSPNSVEEQNPLQYLAKAQADIPEIFSALQTYSKKVKSLKPSSTTEAKLQENVVQSTSRFTSDKAKFDLAKSQLTEVMPPKDLEKIQRNVSEMCIMQAQMHIQRLEFEVSCLQQIYVFHNDFTKFLVEIISSIDDENHPHSNVLEPATQLITSAVSEESSRLITIDTQVTDPGSVRYIIISQVSSKLREDYEQLEAKTVGREFPQTKECFRHALAELDNLLTRCTSIR